MNFLGSRGAGVGVGALAARGWWEGSGGAARGLQARGRRGCPETDWMRREAVGAGKLWGREGGSSPRAQPAGVRSY